MIGNSSPLNPNLILDTTGCLATVKKDVVDEWSIPIETLQLIAGAGSLAVKSSNEISKPKQQ